MYDFQVVSSESELSELDTSLGLRCQFERPNLGRFTKACNLNDGDSPTICNTQQIVIQSLTRGWGSLRGELNVPGGVNI